MCKETRVICYDEDLRIEAYRFSRVAQPFPNHFHQHYVLGVVTAGARTMTVKNHDYLVSRGDVTVFTPYENHACMPAGSAKLDYLGLNISPRVMENWVEILTGRSFLPAFASPLVQNEEIYDYIFRLNRLIFSRRSEFEKEELLLNLLSALLLAEGFQQKEESPEVPDAAVEEVCRYLEAHYAGKITLEDLCCMACQSKSTLLRNFTRQKGITPYRYLETVRVNKARQLLEQGVMPAEAAAAAGFSDQSHFTRYFTMFTGITPAMYRNIL